MSNKLKILFVTSEFAGLVKTGGLGDVAHSLAKNLIADGHEVRVVMPYYASIFKIANLRIIDSLQVQAGTNSIGCAVLLADFQGIPIYLVENHHYFSRPRLYDDGNQEYGDNPERFSVLSMAAITITEKIGYIADVVHAHDWQSAMAMLYVKRLKYRNNQFSKTKAVLTIHNGAFQGKCSAYYRGFLGLGESYNSNEFEEFGHINILKGGVHFADTVNTVSPGYASELLTKEGGHGLDFSYKKKGINFSGILNGCDTDIWNPKTDDMIAKNYDVNDLVGKAVCKRFILNYFNMEYNDKIPVIGIVSRLTHQKGFHYAIPALNLLLKENIKVIAIGDGEIEYVNGLHNLKRLYPEKFSWFNGYNEKIAHQIEAGSDMFLMPSLFEPCGLNQLYSQIYGTLPIVRAVGGLKDTVENCDPKEKKGTGFVFNLPEVEALYNTVLWAIDIYKNNPKHFYLMIKNAMIKDFSWHETIEKYEKIYKNYI